MDSSTGSQESDTTKCRALSPDVAQRKGGSQAGCFFRFYYTMGLDTAEKQVPGPGARKRERPLPQPLPAPDSALGGGRTVPFPCHQFLTGPAAPAESVPASLLARPLCAQQYR